MANWGHLDYKPKYNQKEAVKNLLPRREIIQIGITDSRNRNETLNGRAIKKKYNCP